MAYDSNFLCNPLIAEIAVKPRWCFCFSHLVMSDAGGELTAKAPINPTAFRNSGKIYGVTSEKVSTDLLTLKEVLAVMPQGAFTVYRLLGDDIYCVDIEKTCSAIERARIISIPEWSYGDLSTSGFGVHLYLKRDEFIELHLDELWGGFDKPKMQRLDGAVELLLANHYCVITSNEIARSDYPTENRYSIGQFLFSLYHHSPYGKAREHKRKVTEGIAANERREVAERELNMVHDHTDVELDDKVKDFMSQRPPYRRSCNDSFYNGDHSRFEFGLCGHVYREIRIAHTRLGIEPPANEDLAWIVADYVQDMIPARNKHNTKREHLPWLVYTAKRVIQTTNFEDYGGSPAVALTAVDAMPMSSSAVSFLRSNPYKKNPGNFDSFHAFMFGLVIHNVKMLSEWSKAFAKGKLDDKDIASVVYSVVRELVPVGSGIASEAELFRTALAAVGVNARGRSIEHE